jgi:hypothetical protein
MGARQGELAIYRSARSRLPHHRTIPVITIVEIKENVRGLRRRMPIKSSKQIQSLQRVDRIRIDEGKRYDSILPVPCLI